MPVTPSMSDTARCTRTFIWSRLFCIRRNQSEASATKVFLSRTSVRSMHTCSGGRNEPVSSPQLCRRCIHMQSTRSVFFRPGTLANSRVFTSTTSKPYLSKTSCGAIQYTPVLSIATDSTFRSFIHSAILSNCGVVAPNSFTSLPDPSTFGAHTQWISLAKSIPATFGRSTGNPDRSSSLPGFFPSLSGLTLLSGSTLLSDLIIPISNLSEHDSPGWPFADSDLGECYGSLANVQSPSWSHAGLGAYAPMKKGP